MRAEAHSDMQVCRRASSTSPVCLAALKPAGPAFSSTFRSWASFHQSPTPSFLPGLSHLAITRRSTTFHDAGRGVDGQRQLRPSPRLKKLPRRAAPNLRGFTPPRGIDASPQRPRHPPVTIVSSRRPAPAHSFCTCTKQNMTHTLTPTHTHTHTHQHTHQHTHTHTHTHTHDHTHTRSQTHYHTHTCTLSHTRSHTHYHTHTCTLSQTLHTFTHTHTCTL